MIPIARPRLGEAEEAGVLEVLRSGVLTQGEHTRAFERRFAHVTGAKYAVTTSNGTVALYLALLAHGIGRGDEVITSAMTFIATANAVTYTGARPVFADVDDTLNLSLASVERRIGHRTRAIVAVHLHGNPCDMAACRALAAQHHLVLIQDACQAVGARIGDEPLGAYGTAVYSFYATKNITTGEGGMVTTDDPVVADRCARLRHQAYSDEPYVHDSVGFNFRMTEMQAAIGEAQLAKLEAITQRRRENAAFYDRAIMGVYARPRVLLGARHVYHHYTLRAPDGDARDAIRKRLAERGVATGVYYPRPIHLQPPYVGLANPPCPEAERASADMFSIPVHPDVSDEDRAAVAAEVNRLVGRPVPV